MPLAFGDSLLICIGKVGEQIIGRGIAPKASRTRPLCLRNTDAKSVAAVVAHCLTPGQKSHVVDTANGFVAERQLVSNAVAIDTYARTHSWHWMDDVWLAFWDFASAFPSIAHSWLLFVIRLIGMPCRMTNFISSLYNLNRVVCIVSNRVLMYILQAYCKAVLYQVYLSRSSRNHLSLM